MLQKNALLAKNVPGGIEQNDLFLYDNSILSGEPKIELTTEYLLAC